MVCRGGTFKQRVQAGQGDPVQDGVLEGSPLGPEGLSQSLTEDRIGPDDVDIQMECVTQCDQGALLTTRLRLSAGEPEDSRDGLGDCRSGDEEHLVDVGGARPVSQGEMVSLFPRFLVVDADVRSVLV